ncbi:MULTISPECIES: rRNA maturation RNase YbeY [Glutamicibacter]|uniref:Endoribonuclease YbeY n=1 Tax=Glutamicibacter nicotianae TaxID=37929 RepID=A0ABQ0RGP5_GLUNI|nr:MULTISPECIES: rRNA maturation RNase YbeY [Glutamicibacter]KWR72505.1 rRNA maturation RNase YbeY [Arthrobacter sp. W1]QEP07253.1 rRNA maturation RNase YbeY [Glutamicibacter sp. ZJUTW]UTM47298.1 rRNA maturation RNase YbeY [Glutamicibacter mysorens]WIV45593.1 rRNA maturation RNase YbeY [Glutamicibacter nicotianae]GEC10985.1 endoribonuclease YbeY [Glutamicibacter nicotianae]
MSIEVNNETEYDVDLKDVNALAESVMRAMFLHPETEVSIVFIDEDAMSALHVEWMDLEGPTDVMSFPMDELRPGTAGAPGENGILGDIVICPSVAEAQAKAGGHSTHDEILLLTTHGLLHLMGFDHMEPAEKEEMFALQRKLLESYTGRPAPKETVE